jgi:hypothetical protein
MTPSRKLQGIHSWVGVGLLCSLTIWVTVFYLIEAHRITNNKYISDYKIYYSIASEGN